MTKLLCGEDPVLAALRKQLAAATASRRQFTGTGFYIEFNVPEHLDRAAGRRSFQLGDVYAKIDGLEHGAGFVLFVRDGAIDCLEGYSFDEPWPDEVHEYEVGYVDGIRDLQRLRNTWMKP